MTFPNNTTRIAEFEDFNINEIEEFEPLTCSIEKNSNDVSLGSEHNLPNIQTLELLNNDATTLTKASIRTTANETENSTVESKTDSELSKHDSISTVDYLRSPLIICKSNINWQLPTDVIHEANKFKGYNIRGIEDFDPLPNCSIDERDDVSLSSECNLQILQMMEPINHDITVAINGSFDTLTDKTEHPTVVSEPEPKLITRKSLRSNDILDLSSLIDKNENIVIYVREDTDDEDELISVDDTLKTIDELFNDGKINDSNKHDTEYADYNTMEVVPCIEKKITTNNRLLVSDTLKEDRRSMDTETIRQDLVDFNNLHLSPLTKKDNGSGSPQSLLCLSRQEISDPDINLSSEKSLQIDESNSNDNKLLNKAVYNGLKRKIQHESTYESEEEESWPKKRLESNRFPEKHKIKNMTTNNKSNLRSSKQKSPQSKKSYKMYDSDEFVESVDESEYEPSDEELNIEEYNDSENDSCDGQKDENSEKKCSEVVSKRKKKNDQESVVVPLTNVEPSDATTTEMVTLPPCMGMQQIIPPSTEGGKYYYKKNFCIYCKELQNRLDRHLMTHHAEVDEVKRIAAIKPLTIEAKRARRVMFEQIRLKGNDYYNRNKTINPNGYVICVHRERVKNPSSKKVAKPTLGTSNSDLGNNVDIDNQLHLSSEQGNKSNSTLENRSNKKAGNIQVPLKMICPYCPAMISACSLRDHVRRKHGGELESTKSRQVLTLSKRQMGLCHADASEIVRNNILPKLRTDPIGLTARFDWLIIMYANKFALRYRDIDQQPYVRGHMRLLAKLWAAMKVIDKTIPEFSEAFRPMFWPTMLEGINEVCEHDSKENRFAIIYNAETLPMLIRKCIKILKHQYTIQENEQKVKTVQSFELVFEDDVELQVSYIANLSRKESWRHQDGSKLPTSDDVLTFKNYLELKRSYSIEHFKSGGTSYEHYLNIIQTTSARVLTYNRRRAGEVGKTLLKDFLKAKKADPCNEFFKLLSKEEQKQRLKYVRIDIQGKRSDGSGSLYVSQENEECLNLIVKYRALFNINPKNPYLFAVPDDGDNVCKHVKLCEIMSKLSKECSDNFKEIDDGTIRGTKLRKQLATLNSAVNHGQDPKFLSKHMGHSEKVHNSRYKQPIDKDDTEVTKFLDSVHTNTRLENADEQSYQESTEMLDDPIEEIEKHSNRKMFQKKKINQQATKKKDFSNRSSWSLEEKQDFEKAFQKHIDAKRYPDAKEIRNALKKYNSLADRSEKVIRARFSNIFKKTGKKLNY